MNTVHQTTVSLAYCVQNCVICRPSDSIGVGWSEAVIEPGTILMFALLLHHLATPRPQNKNKIINYYIFQAAVLW